MTRTGTFPPDWFRISIKPRSRYFIGVRVAPSVARMRIEMRQHTGYVNRRQLGACDNLRSPDFPGLCCMVWFGADCIGAGIVAHEMTHAALRVLERRGTPLETNQHRKSNNGWVLTSRSEESFCGIVERFNREFWREYFKRWPQ